MPIADVSPGTHAGIANDPRLEPQPQRGGLAARLAAMWEIAKSTGMVGLPFDQTPMGRFHAAINSPGPIAEKLRNPAVADLGAGFAGTISSGPFKGLTVAEKLERQGGALSSKPGLQRLTRILDDHGMEWVESPSGNGITAYSEVVGPGGRVFKEGKHFADNTSLKTLRDWLGY